MTILNKYSDDATTQVRNASHGQILLRRRGREGNCSLNIFRLQARKIGDDLLCIRVKQGSSLPFAKQSSTASRSCIIFR